MNKAPAFQFYADDFIGGTITMSHEERGLYVLALCIQGGHGSLAHDDIERLGSGMAQPSLSKVKAKFELGEDGRLRQHRMEKERMKQASYRAERSESGKKGAKSKWANGSANGSAIKEPIAQPMANAWPPSPSPSPSPISVSDSDSNSFQPEEPSPASTKPRGIFEGKNSERLPLSEQSKRIAAMFNRRLTTEWSKKEVESYRSIGTVDEGDLLLMEDYYKAPMPPDADYRRRDLLTCLNNWQGEVDRARKWAALRTSPAKPAASYYLPGVGMVNAK